MRYAISIGSGKTFTMNGTETQPGIIPRTIDMLRNHVNSNVIDWEYSLELSIFEIYNDDLIDLLDSSQKLHFTSNEIQHLTKANSKEFNLSEIWSERIKTRKTASTIGNANSSRSHAVTRLEIHSKNVRNQTMRTATINLVDLAGSESPKTTENMIETKAINSSLSALTGVIVGIKKKNTVDYSQCLLTKVLKVSLMGTSKTVLITNLTTNSMEECVKSLTFASTMAK